MMKIIRFANGEYAIRKFSWLKMEWVYLDLQHILNHIRTGMCLEGLTLWRPTKDCYFHDCVDKDFETVLHIYNNFDHVLIDSKKKPYGGVVKIYQDYELAQIVSSPKQK